MESRLEESRLRDLSTPVEVTKVGTVDVIGKEEGS